MASSTGAGAAAGMAEPAAVLRQVRSRVAADAQAGVAGRAITPQRVIATKPLRPVPADIEATLTARAQERLTLLGGDYPRRQLVSKIGGVAAAVGALGLVILVLGLVGGDAGLIAIGAAEFVLFGGGALGLYRYTLADPLRLSAKRLKTAEDASRWTPPETSDAYRRTLLALATDAAQRIVDSPAWRGGALARSGVLIVLGPELDRIATDTEDDERTVTRVAALVAYANTVDGLRGSSADLEPDDVEVLGFLLSSAIHTSG